MLIVEFFIAILSIVGGANGGFDHDEGHVPNPIDPRDVSNISEEFKFLIGKTPRDDSPP